MSEIQATSELICKRLGSVVDPAQVDLVLITLLALKREYSSDPLRFQDKNSNGGRMTFDRRLLLFLEDAPPPGTRRFNDSVGGKMS